MKALLVLGAGGHGRVVADAALECGWDPVAFLDDHQDEIDAALGLPIIGTMASMAIHRKDYSAAIVAMGDAIMRLKLLARLRTAGFEVPTIVHPSASVSKFAAVGPGSVVCAQAAVNAGARLGEGCIINTGATVDHDCILGDGVHVCPGAHLGGDVRIADRTWIGIGAIVRQGIVIGRDVLIGAGATVVADVQGGSTMMGVPAKPKATAP